MVQYNCSVCNFSTSLKANYTRHLKTKKHAKNVENFSVCNRYATDATENATVMQPLCNRYATRSQSIIVNIVTKHLQSIKHITDILTIDAKKKII